MNTTTLMIKGMVCNRCITAVKNALEQKGIRVFYIALGKVEFVEIPGQPISEIRETINCLGFEILADKQEKIVENIKQLVNEVLSGNQFSSIKFSSLVSEKTRSNYDSVSSIFSAKEGVTLEHYIINQKIIRVKKLLEETDMSLSDISFQTNYSSVQHLSRQFKEKEGVNPSQYRLAVRSTKNDNCIN